MNRIIIINGPNLNLIGSRETDIYGTLSFEDYLKDLQSCYPSFHIDYFQSNVEGEIINKLQEAVSSYDGIILNAGGYSHTSVALADTVGAIKTPVVEVHISNIYSREDYRHISLISSKSRGVVVGFGLESYRLALESFRQIEKK